MRYTQLQIQRKSSDVQAFFGWERIKWSNISIVVYWCDGSSAKVDRFLYMIHLVFHWNYKMPTRIPHFKFLIFFFASLYYATQRIVFVLSKRHLHVFD